jgi:hypothetical protein
MNKENFGTLRILALLGIAALTSGCAQLTMNPPQPSVELTQRLRAAGLQPVRVGEFRPDARLAGGADRSINVRGANSMAAPGGSFARHLGETLAVELRNAGLVGAGAETMITGTLLDSQLDAGMSTGAGSIKALIVVTRAGQQRYSREHTASSSWESSFIGAVAIPTAFREYEGLYRKLVAQLIEDPEFRSAVGKR